MIGIYNNAGVRLPMGYPGIEINDTNEIYPVGIVAFNHAYDAVTEPKATRNGMEGYRPRQLVTMLSIEGVVQADGVAQLLDRVEALNTAFDPVLSADADAGAGYLPFTFSVPTENTDDFPTGLKELQVFGRSVSLPVPRFSKYEGDGARFSIELQCVDPRRYLQSELSQILIDNNTVVDNSISTYSSWPVLSIEMAMAGPANWSINLFNDALNTLVLDLSSLSAGNVVTVDMDRREIKVNGVVNQSLFVSGAYFPIPPRSETVQRTVTGTVTESSLTWRPAFV